MSMGMFIDVDIFRKNPNKNNKFVLNSIIDNLKHYALVFLLCCIIYIRIERPE